MVIIKAVPRRVSLALAALAMPVLLGGCFAMQSDLDPIRSDVAVLEKQFVDTQRDVTSLKQRGEDTEGTKKLEESVSDTQARLKTIEKRLDRLESQLKESKQAPVTTAPQPMAPEPVVIEPLESAPPKAPAPPPGTEAVPSAP